jgi:ATP-binding cassette subfamily C protein
MKENSFLSVLNKVLLLLKEVKSKAIISLIILVFKGITEGVGLLFIIPLLGLIGVSEFGESNGKFIQFIHKSIDSTQIDLTVINVLIMYLCVMSFYAMLKYFQSVNTNTISQRVVLRWRNVFFQRITFSSWESIQRHKDSDLQEILTIEIRKLGLIMNQVIQLTGGLILILIYLSLSLLLSFKLTTLSIVPVGLLLLLNRPINKKTYSLGQKSVRHTKEMHSIIQEHIASLKLVKSYRKEKEHIEIFEEKNYASENQSLSFTKMSGKTKLFFEILAALIITIYIYFAIVILNIAVAEILLLIIIFARLLPKVSKIVSNYQQLLNITPAFEYTLDIFNQLEAQKVSWHQEKNQEILLDEKIEFRSIYFSYEDNQVLTDLSFSIQANKTTLILGSSGVGKSTIIDLILGLYQPLEGVIMIDNLKLNTLNQDNWKDQIAYVQQDAFLFHQSILENLLWVKPKASPEEIELALNQAGAFEFVQKLPKGLDTIVGSRGTNLSGGERQRIALARALLRQPQLLILDEATNAVDDKNEMLIKKALNKLHGTMTIIIVAHRSKLIDLADHMIKLP